MTESVYLHIGLYKSGTTYLQHVLWHSRHALADEGILTPGRILGSHVMAVTDLMDLPDARRVAASYGAWPRLVESILEWQGDKAVISVERLSFATPEQIRRILDDFAPATVHIVVTVRDLARVTPSSWQERVRNRKTKTWPEFLAEITDAGRLDEQPARGFWKQQDVGTLLSTWATFIPKPRIHVVTVPPRHGNFHLLPSRFAEVLGSDVSRWTTDVAERHDALGAIEVEYLRRLNTRLVRRVATPDYDRYVKLGLARHVLGVRAGQQRVGLPDEYWPWVQREASRISDEIAKGGYRVVGDLRDLLPTPPPAQAEERPVTRADLLATSFDVATYLLSWLAEHRNGQQEGGSSRPTPLLLHPADVEWITAYTPALLDDLRTHGYELDGSQEADDSAPATSRVQPQDPKLKDRWILNVLMDLSAHLVIRLAQEHAPQRLTAAEGDVLDVVTGSPGLE